MCMAFDMVEIVELSGDITEAIKAYLKESDDEVLDLEIYENGHSDRCVAVAFRAGDVVEGGILLVNPDPDSGENMYSMSGIYEDEGPVANFCPQRILDLLSPTDNEYALDWRERC